MYQFSYAEVVDDSPREMRAREQKAMDQAIRMLAAAQKKGPGTPEMIDALLFLRRLWSIFLEDLQNPDNELPRQLRAGLISIGLWINKEIERVRTGRTTDLTALIEINQIIRNGLN
jgi:flagellar biosynthesis activator protein FlaF